MPKYGNEKAMKSFLRRAHQHLQRRVATQLVQKDYIFRNYPWLEFSLASAIEKPE